MFLLQILIMLTSAPLSYATTTSPCSAEELLIAARANVGHIRAAIQMHVLLEQFKYPSGGYHGTSVEAIAYALEHGKLPDSRWKPGSFQVAAIENRLTETQRAYIRASERPDQAFAIAEAIAKNAAIDDYLLARLRPPNPGRERVTEMLLDLRASRTIDNLERFAKKYSAAITDRMALLKILETALRRKGVVLSILTTTFREMKVSYDRSFVNIQTDGFPIERIRTLAAMTPGEEKVLEAYLRKAAQSAP